MTVHVAHDAAVTNTSAPACAASLPAGGLNQRTSTPRLLARPILADPARKRRIPAPVGGSGHVAGSPWFVPSLLRRASRAPTRGTRETRSSPATSRSPPRTHRAPLSHATARASARPPPLLPTSPCPSS